jgi:hypothetical protein
MGPVAAQPTPLAVSRMSPRPAVNDGDRRGMTWTTLVAGTDDATRT